MKDLSLVYLRLSALQLDRRVVRLLTLEVANTELVFR